MGAFVAAVEGLAETARALDVPFVSGNVSLYNRSSSGNHVAPSPIVGAIGAIDDIAIVTTRGFKRAGSAIVITAPLQSAFGGSVIAEQLGLSGRDLPEFSVHQFARACALVRAGLTDGTIAAAHLTGDGGVLAAIAKMAFASTSGLAFRIDPVPLAQPHGHELVWFSEVPAFVLEVTDGERFAHATATHGVEAFEAGIVIDGPQCELGAQRIALATLRDAWETPLRDFYGSAA
jgi:phosphoribosylformylglycinamidine synthase